MSFKLLKVVRDALGCVRIGKAALVVAASGEPTERRNMVELLKTTGTRGRGRSLGAFLTSSGVTVLAVAIMGAAMPFTASAETKQVSGVYTLTGNEDRTAYDSVAFTAGATVALNGHTKDGGEKTVRLRARAAKVVDLLTGETVAEDADCFTVRFAAPDTRLFGIVGR